MPEVRFISEHARQLIDYFDLHLSSRRPAVQCMIVRIDLLGKEIGERGDVMRGFKHLPGIARMKKRIVLLQSNEQFAQHRARYVILQMKCFIRFVSEPTRLPGTERPEHTRQEAQSRGICAKISD